MMKTSTIPSQELSLLKSNSTANAIAVIRNDYKHDMIN